MKRSVVIGMLALCGLSCGCHEHFDTPDTSGEIPAANITIASLRSFYRGETVPIREELVIGGRVVSSDEAGNFYRTLVLDDGMTQASLGYVGAVLPKSAFLPLFHAMASEDFALISSEIPSAYFTVGAAVTDTDEHFAQHHPKARFNDAELPLGAAAYAAVALGYIADHKE